MFISLNSPPPYCFSHIAHNQGNIAFRTLFWASFRHGNLIEAPINFSCIQIYLIFITEMKQGRIQGWGMEGSG